MFYSLFTDASFSNTHKVGTYAYCCICDEFKAQYSGFLTLEYNNSAEAEAAAIANALHLFIQYNLQIPQVGYILIQSDSRIAIDKIKSRSEKNHEIFNSVHAVLERIRVLNGIKEGLVFYEFRHIKSKVKASERTPAQHINKWCDKEAKSQMGKRLALINKNLNQ